MKEFSPEQIQDYFERLPKLMQEAVTSVETYESIENIGKKYNLMVDEIGELIDQVGLVLIGLEKPSNFVNDICDRLSIKRSEAQMIADDLNREVFAQIRMRMRESQEQEDTKENSQIPEQRFESAAKPNPSPRSEPATYREPTTQPTTLDHISALEHVGGFEIEREGAPMASGREERSHDMVVINKFHDYSPVESTPPPPPATTFIPRYQPKRPDYDYKSGLNTEPLPDTLLDDPENMEDEPVNSEPVKIELPKIQPKVYQPAPTPSSVPKPVAPPAPKPIPPKVPGIDPYLEPLE